MQDFVSLRVICLHIMQSYRNITGVFVCSLRVKLHLVNYTIIAKHRMWHGKNAGHWKHDATVT